MKKQLIIIGTSNNAKLASYFFRKHTDYQVIGFAVNKEYLTSDSFDHLPVFPLEGLNERFPPSETDAFVAVGYNDMNRVRETLYHQARQMGYTLPNYISPHCTFLTEEEIGDNNFILEDNTIQPFVKIGSNNVLWSGNHIGHDVQIGDHNYITSHVVISGFAQIGNHCFLGVNASLRDGLKIADKTLIAAGAVVMKSTETEQVILPARSVIAEKKSTELKIS